MSMTQMKLGVLAFSLFGAVAAGEEPVRQAGKPDLQNRQAGKPDLQNCQAKKAEIQQAATPADMTVKPGAGRMFVTGHVLDPDGKPVFGASVAVHARRLGLLAPGAALPRRREEARFRWPTLARTTRDTSASMRRARRRRVTRTSA